ncbi:MAG: DUF2452 domain-containing protein [Luminiphilus sp.]|jgi:hypothetical protein|nr:DUF2452 domain-containing protein [Luminiphilus sp.]
MDPNVTSRAKNTHQGKGLTLVLQDLTSASPNQLHAKSSEEAAQDYCWSALVLSAAFGFRVTPGQQYHLYLTEEAWCLSLLSPAEWGLRIPGAYVGECHLRHDMTWGLTFNDAVAAGSPVHSALLSYLEGIREQLMESGSWEALLRQGERHLAYQQRVLATALASSLRQSLTLSGQAGVPPAVPALSDALALPHPAV